LNENPSKDLKRSFAGLFLFPGSSAHGYVTIGSYIIGYVISPTKFIFIDTSNADFVINTADQ
jgi:hypothetical protein